MVRINWRVHIGFGSYQKNSLQKRINTTNTQKSNKAEIYQRSLFTVDIPHGLKIDERVKTLKLLNMKAQKPKIAKIKKASGLYLKGF